MPAADSLAVEWPELELETWRPTRDLLHMWTQMVGKTLLAGCPPQNHWWHTALRVSARGLAGAAPVRDGVHALDIELDLVDHVLAIRSSVGRTAAARSEPEPAAAARMFFEDAYAAGADLGRWDRAALERAGPSAPRFI